MGLASAPSGLSSLCHFLALSMFPSKSAGPRKASGREACPECPVKTGHPIAGLEPRENRAVQEGRTRAAVLRHRGDARTRAQPFQLKPVSGWGVGLGRGAASHLSQQGPAHTPASKGHSQRLNSGGPGSLTPGHTACLPGQVPAQPGQAKRCSPLTAHSAVWEPLPGPRKEGSFGFNDKNHFFPGPPPWPSS